MSRKLAMIAFGGNALLRAGPKGTLDEQIRNVTETCAQLRPLVDAGYDLVIGHGNGPQVGNGLLRHAAGATEYGLEPMPMDFCGAETQGSIAYLIQTGLERAGFCRPAVSLVTRVEVKADDPAFRHPTKPVGPYYKEIPDSTAVYKQDPQGRGWRKVVPSPEPVAIENIGLVEKLAREGYVVITVGGGGIPVVKEQTAAGQTVLKGVEAVIDKDLACALAATQMQADELYILTDVPKVYIHFHTPQEQALDTLTVAQAREYLAQGMFTEGSMAPKVRAGIRFVENGGKVCIITEAGQLNNPACGTRIIQ